MRSTLAAGAMPLIVEMDVLVLERPLLPRMMPAADAIALRVNGSQCDDESSDSGLTWDLISMYCHRNTNLWRTINRESLTAASKICQLTRLLSLKILR